MSKTRRLLSSGFSGEFAPIGTAVPGVQICEHLPEIARRMNHLALVRTMTCNPNFGDHRTAVHGLLGGIDELPAGATLAASRRDCRSCRTRRCCLWQSGSLGRR